MDVTRRGFLQAAGGVGLGLGAAPHAAERLIPFLIPPENIVPGIATWYATTCRECPAGCGLILRNREGRVVKAEGNPQHPGNRGALCALGQASLQGLYDPDRVRQPLRLDGEQRTAVPWPEATAAVADLIRRHRGRISVITDLPGPTMERVLRQWLAALGVGPERLLIFEPLNYAALRAAHRALYGLDIVPRYSLSGCDVILSLDADFLATWHAPLRLSRELADLREPMGGLMARLIHAGPHLSLTAANADERLVIPPGRESLLALALLHVLVRDGLVRRPDYRFEPLSRPYAPEVVARRLGLEPAAIIKLAHALGRARQPVVLAGPAVGESAEAVEAAAAGALLNSALASGAVDFARAQAIGRAADAASVNAFAQGGSQQELVVVLGANPVYALPANHPLRQRLAAATVVSLSTQFDETAALADWILPTSHALESWGDCEAESGVHSIQQPTMGAVFGTPSAGQLLFDLAEGAGVAVSSTFGAVNFYEALRLRWRELHQASGAGGDAESFWQAALQTGGWFPALPSQGAPALGGGIAFSPPQATNGLTLHAFPSAALYDGRGANKPWLQELPDPITHVTWGSWVELNRAEAEQQGIGEGDLLEVTAPAGSFTAPAMLSDFCAPGAVAVPLGQGHTEYGRQAKDRGVNALPLVAFGTPWPAVTLRRVGEAAKPITTDGGLSQEGRELIQHISLAELATAQPPKIGKPLPEAYQQDHDLYEGHEHAGGHRWGMVIDLNRCTGCSGCVTACYAENNVPVVGPEMVAMGREMSWLRVERYYEEHPAEPVQFLPMLCQHCDAAPCEPVCPVFAAYHTDEGLNGQVYNRCIGTRYCANNCPWKVRRFNWFEPDWPEPLNWQLNPDVTARSRGVMEKCTFCVQRIRGGERQAKIDQRPLRDGDIVPACAQACASRAIVFGDLMDPNSEVSRRIESNRRYQVLGELNTRPAVIYLKRVVRDGEA